MGGIIICLASVIVLIILIEVDRVVNFYMAGGRNRRKK